MWPVIINGFGICYMLNFCVLSRYLSPEVEILITLSGKNIVGEKFRQLPKISSIFSDEKFQTFVIFPVKKFKISSFSIQISVNLVSQNKQTAGCRLVAFLSHSRRNKEKAHLSM